MGGQAYVPAGEVVYLEMHRLLFGKAGAIATYCCVACIVAVIIAKVPGRPVGHYTDNFVAIFWLEDGSLPDNLWGFVKDILKVELRVDKFVHGVHLLFLGMQLRLSPKGVSFCLIRQKYTPFGDSNHRQRKYVHLL